MTRTIWFGPVSRPQVGAGADVGMFQCTGDGSDGQATCSVRAEASGGLTAIARSYGIADDELLDLRAFSAGGQVVKRVLKDPAARARVAVVQLADGTYETEPGAVAEGFAAYGLEAARGERIFVATASRTPNKSYPNGAEVLDALRLEIERRAGEPFVEVELPWAPRPPAHAWQLGHALLVDWGLAYGHGEHATVLAALVRENVVEPWLASPGGGGGAPPAGGAELTPSARGLLGFGLAMLALGVAGIGAYLLGYGHEPAR